VTWWRGSAGFGIAAIGALLGVASPALAVDYYLATDVPATLGASDYTTNQIVRSQNAAYVLERELAAGVGIAALHRRTDGVWLFSPSHPVSLGNVDYEPRDVVSFYGAGYSSYLDGSAEGIPEYARIDALLVDSSGAPVLSFDVPVDLGGTEYSPSDLVRFSGGAFSLYWDAQAAGVPAYANLVGADRDCLGTLVVTFDVPTDLGGIDYLPGQLVQWNGAGFNSYFTDPGWPAGVQLRDFSIRLGQADTDRLYTINTATEELVIVDAVSGATTVVGTIPEDMEDVDLAISTDGNVLYALNRTPAFPPPTLEICRIDAATAQRIGACQLLSGAPIVEDLGEGLALVRTIGGDQLFASVRTFLETDAPPCWDSGYWHSLTNFVAPLDPYTGALGSPGLDRSGSPSNCRQTDPLAQWPNRPDVDGMTALPDGRLLSVDRINDGDFDPEPRIVFENFDPITGVCDRVGWILGSLADPGCPPADPHPPGPPSINDIALSSDPGSRFYGIERSGSLYHFSAAGGAVSDIVPLTLPGFYSGLALKPATCCAAGQPVPEVCNGLDDDCDGAVPPDEVDGDGDGRRVCQSDCDDTNGDVWAKPGEVVDLDVTSSSGDILFTWDTPADLGGMSVKYDLITSELPWDFVTPTSPASATCLATDWSSTSFVMSLSSLPADRDAFVVRAVNACPGSGGRGSTGSNSAGQERPARSCP
jgi:hypothetical protein